MSIKQVVARRMDRLGELQLLAGQVPVAVLGQLVGEDEQAVERRSQLVTHVREELGLVLAGEGKLLRLFLQGLPGLLDLLLLALDFLVLVGEEAGLLLEFLVGRLQFLLAGLQLLGERLRLLEQPLRPHVRFDRVEHDADRLGELFEERLVRGVEAADRREFQHAPDRAFENQRAVPEHCAAGPTPSPDEIRMYSGGRSSMQDLLFLEAHWPTSP